MARIFNIYFSFEEASHSAIVTVRTAPPFTEYTLNHFDAALMDRLPGNKILSNDEGQLYFKHAAPHHSNTLMNEIIRAVMQHLQITEA